MCERRRGGRFFMHRRSFSRARAKAACRHRNLLKAVERLSAPLLQTHPQNGRRPVTFLQVTCVNMPDAFELPEDVGKLLRGQQHAAGCTAARLQLHKASFCWLRLTFQHVVVRANISELLVSCSCQSWPPLLQKNVFTSRCLRSHLV